MGAALICSLCVAQQAPGPRAIEPTALTTERLEDEELAEESMQSHDTIVKDKEILGGTPVFRGTRVPFQALLDYLEGNQTIDEFLDDFPTVSKEDAIAALKSASSLLVGQLE